MIRVTKGTAGLDVKRLASLLEQVKIDCTMIEGDEGSDHCLLLLSRAWSPKLVALLEYENKGFEPRIVTLKIFSSNEDELESQSCNATESVIRIAGRRSGDVGKIVGFVADVFPNCKVRRL